MDSFIGWIGGKKLLRKDIIKRFPPEYDRYIEVFGGAGWILFGKGYNAKQLEVFNDVNSDLINLYRCIKYHCAELQKELRWTIASRELFFHYKSQMEKEVGLTDIQKAARYLCIIKYSFGNYKKSFATNGSGKDISKTILFLQEVQERLKHVVIENKDFENLIKVYDRPKALFYLDPPYVNTEKYYDGEFNMNDHIRLNNALKNIKGNFILSYNDCDFIRELYKDFKVESVMRNNNLSNKLENRLYKEVLIKNY